MRTLNESINRLEKGMAQALHKHLSAVGISAWSDITRSSLYELRDYMADTLAPGSQKTILANLKAIFKRVKDDVEIPSDYAEILSVKGDTCRSTYLTPEELKAFEAVQVKGRKARIVQVESLIEAYTGARISDVMTFTEENFTTDGYLTYTSKKTKVTATIPVSEKTRGWILYAQEHRGDEPTKMSRTRIIRRIAKDAGITKMVKTRRGGIEKTAPKCEVISSHSFRKSCATNLVMAGASLTEAKICLGHTNEAMTSRYVVATRANLSKEAMRYFM